MTLSTTEPVPEMSRYEMTFESAKRSIMGATPSWPTRLSLIERCCRDVRVRVFALRAFARVIAPFVVMEVEERSSLLMPRTRSPMAAASAITPGSSILFVHGACVSDGGEQVRVKEEDTLVCRKVDRADGLSLVCPECL
jgi:hypothetical protein